MSDESKNESTGMALAVPASADEHGHVTAGVVARIQARTVMAFKCPRDIDQARAQLMKDAKRPGFAAVAEYAKPIGGSKVRGPSIRFAEAAVRAFRNIDLQATVTHETDEDRTVHLEASDLEANLTYEMDVVVSKTIERRRKQDGDEVLRTRSNRQGEILYILRATDDDVTTKQAAAISKGFRTLALRLIPGDLVEEAMAECRKTREREDAQDPDAAKKRLLDSFSGLGVRPSDLATYLDHPTDQCSPSELDDLRAIYTAIRDRDTTWHNVMTAKFGEAAGDDAGKAQASAIKVAIDKAKSKLTAKAAGSGGTPASGQQAAAGAAAAASQGPDPRDVFVKVCADSFGHDEETARKWAAEQKCPTDKPWTTAHVEKMRKLVKDAGGRWPA